MANKRIKDLPAATDTVVGDILPIDGTTTRGITVENFLGDNLDAIKGLTSAADKGIQFTGSGTAATYDLTTAGKALLDDADAAAQRTTLGLVIGTNVQAQDAGLQSIAGLTTAADKMIYTTASDTYAVTTVTSFARTILDDADAATARTTLGLGDAAVADTTDFATAAQGTTADSALQPGDIGDTVQGYDASLADIAGLTFAQGDVLYYDGANIVNLAKGTDGQFLKIGATIPEWATLAGGGDLLSTNNLTDVANAATSLSNLGGAPLAGNKNLTGGFTTTSFNAGTKSSGTFTPDPGSGNVQHYTNGGAHTLAPPSAACTMIIECTNASAGALTTSGFTIVDGDTYSSSGTKKHIFYITKTNSFSHLNVRYVTGT